MHDEDITHEAIADATRRYLEAGGVITLLPDTFEEQKQHLMLLFRLEALDDLAGL